MNQASRGKPFSTTLTSRNFFGSCTSTASAFRLFICSAIAHSMCSSRSGCSPRRLSSARRWASSQGALPSATAILRSQRRWPMRRIADPSVTLQKPRFAPGEQLHQRWRMQRFAWTEILFIGEAVRNGSTDRSADNHHNRKYGCR